MPDRQIQRDRLPLRERKQQQARERIVAAAEELFAERGFSGVTVTDIADRADVGRTTFFRYFGDKQEVVFADEQRSLDALAAEHRSTPSEVPMGLFDALAQARPLVVAICADAVRDPVRWALHEQLLQEHLELADRNARKLKRYAEIVEEILLARGTPWETALLAAQVGLACYYTGRRLAGDDAGALVSAVDGAFGDVLGVTSRR